MMITLSIIAAFALGMIIGGCAVAWHLTPWDDEVIDDEFLDRTEGEGR
jgi:hypothetical protein